ncbi:MAG: TIGR03619 family F420-dependent LLM class oxidoreductase [Dehalococcoidia bacterium]|nr:TIGR03619 family F420-dependent LLM class oxidoreductase [Dehalococcoidia bacterium]
MSVRIGLSLSTLPFSSARALWRWVERCEASDVDSIWQTDRLVSAEPLLEPLAFAAALAGGTERLKFGMNVLVLPLRDPLVLAKQCASIDYLSGGRLLPAFGVGGNAAVEWGATGRDARVRGAQADEALAICTRLWAGERVTFEGAHYRYRDVAIAPLPVQRPLPLWIGGSSAVAIRRTARFGTGWIGGIQTAAQVAPVVAAIRAAARAAERPIDDDHYGAGFAFRFGSWEEPAVQQAAAGIARFAPDGDARDYLAVGDAAAIVERVQQYVAAGVSKFVLRPLGAGDADVMAQTERLIAEVLPQVHGR